jgi:hypothetical protein
MLVGAWLASDESGETFQFARAEGNSYALIQTEGGGKRGRFEAHYFKAGGASFIDLYPETPDLDATDYYEGHLVPVHSFLQVEISPDTLKMRYMDPEWLEGFLEENGDALKHETENDGLLLTAPTAELQKFMVEHLSTEGAYAKEWDTYTRVQ